MRTALADLLVREDSLKLFREDLLLVLGHKELVNLINNLGEELEGVLIKKVNL